jgi:DNA-binding HxlR family transcriptional regulator
VPTRPAAPSGPRRSRCPVSSALEILGDIWTLLVVRDLLWFGKRRFAELLASGEGISTNILTDRLERLECEGVVTRRKYQDRPPRYEYVLTSRGRDLEPVLRELVRWGSRHVKGTLKPPAGF